MEAHEEDARSRTDAHVSRAERRNIWVVILLALGNHLILDPVLTLYRLQLNPSFHELNPLWRGMLQTNPLLVLVTQSVLVGGILLCYLAIFRFIDRAKAGTAERLYRWLWWGTVGVLLWGLFLTAHHLWYLFELTG